MDGKECKKLEAKVKRMEDEHRKKMRPLREEIEEYHSEKQKKRWEKLVGKFGVCEKYKWNLYSQIIGVHDSGVRVLKFEKTDEDEINITISNEWGVPNWLFKKSISSRKFDMELKRILKKVVE